MRTTLPSNTANLGGLNEDALRAIFGYLALPSLKAMSLTNKRLSNLVTSLLFASFNLTTHSPEDLDEIRHTVLKGDQARLSHHRFKTLLCEISELGADEDLDEDAAESGEQSACDATIAAYLRFLAAIKSAEILALTVNLSSDAPVDDALLSALVRFGKLASRKCDKVKLELLCDGLEDEDEQKHPFEGNSSRIKCLLRTIPASMVSSLHLSGVNGISPKTASAIGEIINSFANLTTLELTECLINMTAWKPSGLKAFSLSCIGEGSMQKSLLPAYGITNSSFRTLEHITMHNTQGCKLQAKMPPTPLRLPRLQHLELADRDISQGSLLALLLPYIKAPKLRYLDLDLADIFTPDLSVVVTKIPTLRGLHLGQGLLRCESDTTVTPSNPGFIATKLACAKAGIDLRVTYTTELYDTIQDLTDEMMRVKIAAEHLVTLSLGLTATAAAALKNSQFQPLPMLTHLFIALVPSNSAEDASPAKHDSSFLSTALENIEAPLMRSLKLSISTGNKIDAVRAVIATLGKGHFHKLSVVGAEILQDQLQVNPEHEESLQSAIFEVSTDSTSLRFITVLDEQAAASDDETIVDSEEDMLGTSFGKLEIDD